VRVRGRRVAPAESLATARARCRDDVAALPEAFRALAVAAEDAGGASPRGAVASPVELSAGLEALVARLRATAGVAPGMAPEGPPPTIIGTDSTRDRPPGG
jgi:hypothetical protein